ncbi:hypothetical protein [Listeria kieliensis]|uniref:Uncharacterized protein n=1 Tax=Listeria kieliensis TaxID=1621700 RepID=A0A3D8TSK1_9LIST|nr:hypothetical protein [Listeria kieliensis]RDX00706.1 hypothetical protein UR08_06910 [Listeria kieliensis]
MELSFQRRLEELEQDYTRTHKKQEENLEEIYFQNRGFEKGLDDLADRLRYVTSRYDSEQMPPMGKGYSIISHAHEEGNYLVKQLTNELEEEMEHTTQAYDKERTRYEEEYLLAKKKEGEQL